MLNLIHNVIFISINFIDFDMVNPQQKFSHPCSYRNKDMDRYNFWSPMSQWA